MKTTEICPLTEKAVARLLAGRDVTAANGNGKERRKAPRWPFPGTVELWVPDSDGTEHHTLATSLNLGGHGIGIRCDEPLSTNLELAIAIHEPELSMHGRAVVRHCTKMGDDYLIGLKFLPER